MARPPQLHPALRFIAVGQCLCWVNCRARLSPAFGSRCFSVAGSAPLEFKLSRQYFFAGATPQYTRRTKPRCFWKAVGTEPASSSPTERAEPGWPWPERCSVANVRCYLILNVMGST